MKSTIHAGMSTLHSSVQGRGGAHLPPGALSNKGSETCKRVSFNICAFLGIAVGFNQRLYVSNKGGERPWNFRGSFWELSTFRWKVQEGQWNIQWEPRKRLLLDFYRTQVSLGSSLWVPVSLTPYDIFVKLYWCDSGWWWYQLNTSWWC